MKTTLTRHTLRTLALMLAAATATACSDYAIIYAGGRNIRRNWTPERSTDITTGGDPVTSQEWKVGDVFVNLVDASANRTENQQPTTDNSDLSANADLGTEVGSIAMHYSIDDVVVSHTATESDELRLIYRLLGDARGGHSVTIAADTPTAATADSDTVTMNTTNMEYVVEWTRVMVRRGYAVTIVYNPDTGIYKCTAIRKSERGVREE